MPAITAPAGIVGDDAINPAYSLITGLVPDWFKALPAHQYAALRSATQQPLDWYEQACLQMPETVAAFHAEHAHFRWLESQKQHALGQLTTLEAFAEPLLKAAITQRFGLEVDVRRAVLFHPKLADTPWSFANLSKDPAVEAAAAVRRATQPLLTAALQNFVAGDTQAGGMDLRRMKAVIYDPANEDHTLAIAPHEFAALCRELDLGGQYQKTLEAVFNPASAADQAPGAAAFNQLGLLKRCESSTLKLHACVAYMKKHISERTYGLLLDVADNKRVVQNASPLLSRNLQLRDVDLTGVVAIGPSDTQGGLHGPFTVYIPEDPVCPLKEYASTLDFVSDLRDRMFSPGYLDFFRGLVADEQADALFATLTDRLYPLVWAEGGQLKVRRPDRQAKLHVRMHDYSQSFLTEFTRRKVRKLQTDALYHGVPTVVMDDKAREARLAYFAGGVLQALNIGAFFVPVLGQVMMVVSTVQLAYESYEGIESWSRGEREQAFGYLMDVVENVALFAALGAAGAGAGTTPALERIPVETPSFIEELQSVTLANGKTRLIKPDITPFAHDILLPAGLKPDALGLYHYQGKTWLALEDRVYSVKTSPGNPPQQRIEHPTKAISYEPLLRHNDAGAWQHEFERPRQWQGHMLFRRLGPSASGFSEETARRILAVSDTHESVLRRVLTENQRPPALLEDTLRRFRLDHEVSQDLAGTDANTRITAFQARYQTPPVDQAPSTQTITRRYPALPVGIADELAHHASPAELEQLLAGKVPLRLAQEIQTYQQQVRLARAYEGLYLDNVNNPDTDRLVLHSVARLPGWADEIRIELRQGRFTGPLIDQIGAPDGPVRKVLAQHADGYQTYDGEGHELHGRDTLYSAILHALPDANRAALGFPNTWEGPALKQHVQQLPLLPRPELRNVLHMQPAKPGANSPMRLADGRVGYPLSGRGSLASTVLREDLLYLIRLLALEQDTQSAEAVLAALEGAGLSRVQISDRLNELMAERDALDQSLTAWSDAALELPDLYRRLDSRTRIQDALWQHWQATNLPEIGRGAATLRLDRILLIDYPAQLPAFFEQRIVRLQLVDYQGTGLLTSQTLGANIGPELQAVDNFLQRFRHLTSLEVSSPQGLTYSTLNLQHRQAFATLRELRLHDTRLGISGGYIAGLSDRFPNLEVLDLSGSPINYFEDTPNIGNVRLRYLGLDRTGLVDWPAWLNSQSLTTIDHLSLRDNALTSVPDELALAPRTAQPRRRISLQGNLLSRRTILTLLADQPSEARQFDMAFDTPPSIQQSVQAYRRDQQEVLAIFDNWANASSSSNPLSEQATVARRQIGEAWLAFMRADFLGATGPLQLTDISLANFPPQLPPHLYARVRELQLLRMTATREQLNRLLGHFTQLEALTLDGHVAPTGALPNLLASLPDLQHLTIRIEGGQIDDQAMAMFARMPQLESLNLEGNRLAASFDNENLQTLSDHLTRLTLSNTGLHAWPAWVETLLPLDILDLDDNQIVNLPDNILYNPRNDHAHTEISLRGNPLSDFTMSRAHGSEARNRSYSFLMDLPDEILQEHWRERHDSDSESDDSDDDDSVGSGDHGHAHSPALEPEMDAPDVDDWLLASVEENEAHRTVWETLQQGGEAPALLELVGRLVHTASYRTLGTRADFVARVWRILEVAGNSAEERALFNGMAHAGVERNGQGLYQTCHDGAWLVFNQMEIKVFTEQALKALPEQSRGQALYRLVLRLYRLEAVETIARERAGTRDEAEVRMAYKLNLAEALELPLAPKKMLYQACANVSPAELDAARAQVLADESGDPFLTFAARQDAWVDYLRETYAERFAVLEQDYQQRVLDAPDETREPGGASPTLEALAPLFERLKLEYEQKVAHLIRELTIAESYRYA